ncbi:MAG TPA: S41 family peptidase, partial [Bacilli bacterium]
MIKLINNKIKKFISYFTLSVVLVSLLILPYTVTAADTISSHVEVDEIFGLIKNNHVSGISESKLADAAIEGMLSALDDPYTQYFNKNEWEAFADSLERNYVGVGIRVGEDGSGFYVAEVFPNSPAQLAGILKGDYIISADGVLMKGKTITELVSMISGPAGTTVKVTIAREQKSITFTMKRQKITIPNVTNKTFSEGTGYIRISSFSSDADEAFTAQLEEMKKSGMNSLVVDLRDNPGGYLDTTANMAKHFIKEGTLIHTKDRDSIDNPVKVIGGTPLTIPIVVLVNGNSASASEVLTGFLQDYNLAKVVGTLTYGKGSVQNIFPLSNGGALKITIQEYL